MAQETGQAGRHPASYGSSLITQSNVSLVERSKAEGFLAGETIKLDHFKVVIADDIGFFQTSEEIPTSASPGQLVRLTLYWEALAAPNAERTVSIRLQDAAGDLVAQHDMMPVDGSRPTSWWQPGWRFRDVYYLSIAPNAISGYGSLDLVLYDSYSQERVLFEESSDFLRLLNVYITDRNLQSNETG